jgi:GT2 family glycosyltransferase
MDAAAKSDYPCGVTVVDNGSTDGSVEWLARTYPGISVVPMPNLGLASFNRVVAERDEEVVLLLNTDVKLDANAIGPLVGCVVGRRDALFAAPKCWTFDRSTYEGMRTRVRSRFGMVQGMCRVPGFERFIEREGLTASAGPVLAVHRERFLELGGYDLLYWPGRIEDLDLGFRGWMEGWRGYYVPSAVAYHKGFGSFGPAFGEGGCDRLAIRNTLLFCWKNLRGRRRAVHLAWLAARVAHAAVTGRRAFLGAVRDAVAIWRAQGGEAPRPGFDRRNWVRKQEEFFRAFRWGEA